MACFDVRQFLGLVACAYSKTYSSLSNSLFLVSFLLNTVGMTVSEIYTTMSEEFDRLHRSVFEDISRIQVADDPTSITRNLLPFLHHQIASESATEDPFHEITFCVETLQDFEAAEFEALEPLLVRRTAAWLLSQISLNNFIVISLHIKTGYSSPKVLSYRVHMR